jgi:hypothetical protein
MNGNKLLLNVASDLLRKKSFVDIINDTRNSFRSALREEIQSAAFKVICGIILSSVMIFSLIVLGAHMNYVLNNQEMGPYPSMLVFGVIAALCFGLLFYTFKDKKAKRKEVAVNQPLFGTNMQRILIQFLDGLNEGVEEAAERKRERDKFKQRKEGDHLSTVWPDSSTGSM